MFIFVRMQCKFKIILTEITFFNYIQKKCLQYKKYGVNMYSVIGA